MKLLVSVLVVCLVWSGATAQHDDDDAFVSDDVPSTVPETQNIDADLYVSPQIELVDGVYLQDNFDDGSEAVNVRWQRSTSKKAPGADADEEIAKYDGVWNVEAPVRPLFGDRDLGLVLKSQAKHAAIAAKLRRPFTFADQKPLVVQYEVQLQDGQTCGGAYLKLLTEDVVSGLDKFNDKTPYSIMFGPDKCGNDIKLHFIFNHLNPLTGLTEEKHCRKSKDRLEEPFKDKQPHLYTLIVRPDNTYTIRVDHRVVNEGSLLADFTPAVNPEREIDDPTDSKPSDWDEREKIPDPSSQKPEDWDEDAPAQIKDASAKKPEGWLDDEDELIPDPTAVKPDDWDTEMDGDWEAPLITNEVCVKAVGCGLWQTPMISNPAYKGRWHAPLIENPNYQGKWAPRKIVNPDWFEDLEPFRRMRPISAIGFELWSMSGNILFDNILITDSEDSADQFASKGYDLKRDKIDTDAESFLTRVTNYANENPYMYAVFLVFVGLPMTFIMYYFCKSAPEKPYESNLKLHKKTDLNEEADASNDEADIAAEESPIGEPPTDAGSSDIHEDSASSETQETAKPDAAADNTRKRRPRKD